MSRPHLLRVDAPAEAFAALLAALAAAGGRSGWLELGSAERGPEALERAAALGALRAVAVGERGAVAVKRRRGPARLDALLREHFAGCRLVLVRGAIDAPRLEPDGDGWRLDRPAGGRRWTTGELVAALSRPRPFDAE